MTNREQIDDLIQQHSEALSRSTTHEGVAQASQVTSMGALLLIAQILDEMNERERAKVPPDRGPRPTARHGMYGDAKAPGEDDDHDQGWNAT